MTPEDYAERLAATGMPEREVARAYFYAVEYGLDALSGTGDVCVEFDVPTCRDINCVAPEHQRLVYTP